MVQVSMAQHDGVEPSWIKCGVVPVALPELAQTLEQPAVDEDPRPAPCRDQEPAARDGSRWPPRNVNVAVT